MAFSTQLLPLIIELLKLPKVRVFALYILNEVYVPTLAEELETDEGVTLEFNAY